MNSEYQVGAVADIIARLSKNKPASKSSPSDDSTASTNKKKRKLNQADSEIKHTPSKKKKSSKNPVVSDLEIHSKKTPKQVKNGNKTDSKKNTKLSKSNTKIDIQKEPDQPMKKKKSNLSNELPKDKTKKKTILLKQNNTQSDEIEMIISDIKDKKKNKKQLKKKIKHKKICTTQLLESQLKEDKSQYVREVSKEIKPSIKKGKKTDSENEKAGIESVSKNIEVEQKTEDSNNTESKFPKHVLNTSEQDKDEPKFNEEQESRTIFVGNLPLKITRSRVTNMFKPYGEVETVRFRSIPVADIKLPRKACVKMNMIHEKRTNMNAYVRFKNMESVEKALVLNGLVLEEHTIRVDTALKKTTTNSHAIFIGNLPFEAEEEELRKAFEDCGDIENVRVIRDQFTNIGKGFAYVNFKSADAVAFALEMENVKIRNREVRIKRCFDKKSGGKSFNGFGNFKPINSGGGGFPKSQGLSKSFGKGNQVPQGRFHKGSDRRDGFKGKHRVQRFGQNGGRREFGARGEFKGRSDASGFRGKDSSRFNRGAGRVNNKDNSAGSFKKKMAKSDFQGSTVGEKGNRNNQKKKKLGYDALKKFIIAKKLTSGGEKKKAFNFLSN